MAESHTPYKRVNILIRKDQHELVSEHNLSLSGLVRDLLDDRFSNTTITLSVNRKTRKLYDHIVSNFGASDSEIEVFIVKALDSFLASKSNQIDDLRKKLKN